MVQYRQFHTLPDLLDSRAALSNSACQAGKQFIPFYDDLWYDPVGMRIRIYIHTHTLTHTHTHTHTHTPYVTCYVSLITINLPIHIFNQLSDNGSPPLYYVLIVFPLHLSLLFLAFDYCPMHQGATSCERKDGLHVYKSSNTSVMI